jgi:predicted enzyme related to lactoylglutathione lyase
MRMIKGLATAIYHVRDLDRAKAWYTAAFQQAPYFDQPFYVGFNIGGYELGLDPDPEGTQPGPGGTVAYWRVGRIDDAVRHFVAAGATLLRARRTWGKESRSRRSAIPSATSSAS